MSVILILCHQRTDFVARPLGDRSCAISSHPQNFPGLLLRQREPWYHKRLACVPITSSRLGQTHRISVRVLLDALPPDASLLLPLQTDRVGNYQPTKEERTREAADLSKIPVESGRCSISIDYGNCIVPEHSQLVGLVQFCQRSGNAFTVTGPAEGRNSALINAEVDVQCIPYDRSSFWIQRPRAGRSR